MKKYIIELEKHDLSDLNVIIHLLWRFRYVFLLVVLLSLSVGLISFLFQNKEYEAKSELLLETPKGSGLGQLGNLAGMAGISLSSSSENNSSIDPMLYEKIILSHSFISHLLQIEFNSTKYGKWIDLEEFFMLERFDGELPPSYEKEFLATNNSSTLETLYVLDSGANILEEYSSFQNIAINQLKARFTILVEDQLLSLTVKMPEPEIAVQLNLIVLNKLKELLTAYKTEKLNRNVQFIEARKIEAQEKYQKSQGRLAKFRDQNQGIISQAARTHEENLQFEMTLAFNLYQTLSQSLEQSELQLKKETPLFFYIEKPVINRKHVEPKFILYFFIYFGLGIVLNGIFLFGFMVYLYLNKLNKRYE